MSQGYLSTKFKKYNGISLKKFIVKHRITKSKHLLESTSLTIEEIALKSGFSDSCYFHRIFKKETGYTPLKFKKISLK
ncbi:TPA: helix-turn-helix domain-containing protein [Streptococcus pyogenes]|uniref:helix-turn-helix domain-containing protein n=1 Tax=Streptococcus pyogenes TaxID=1314 RepID=UPI0034A0C747